MNDFTDDDLRQAYNLLDVPCSASVRSIKHSYRRIAKRWHPDRYRAGTPAYADATQMMKRINEAYSLIENAPLLDRTVKNTAAPTPPRNQPNSEPSSPSNPTSPKTSINNDSAPVQFGRHLWDGILEWILMRIVFLPIVLPVVFLAIFIIDTLFHRLPILNAAISNAGTQSWLISITVAIFVCCVAAKEIWKFRRHWIVWFVFAGLLVAHFLLVVPLSAKLLSSELIDGVRLAWILMLLEIAALLGVLNFVITPLEKARDISRLHSN